MNGELTTKQQSNSVGSKGLQTRNFKVLLESVARTARIRMTDPVSIPAASILADGNTQLLMDTINHSLNNKLLPTEVMFNNLRAEVSAETGDKR